MGSNMGNFVVVIFLAAFIGLSYSLKILPLKCPGIKFHKVGCFDDLQSNPRPLPKLMFTDRDRKSAKFSGQQIQWKNWDKYMIGLICRCAQAALKNNYNIIGLQHYGECFSGPNTVTAKTYNKDGKSEFCIDGKANKCKKDEPCIGEDHVNFVYLATKVATKPTTRPTNQPSTRAPTQPKTPPPTPAPTKKTTKKPLTPRPTNRQTTRPTKKPTTKPQTPKSTNKPSTPTNKQSTPKPTKKPSTAKPPTTNSASTTASATSTARPPIKPTQPTGQPCALPAQIACIQPVQQCLYPPCVPPPPIVPPMVPVMPLHTNGCGKSGIECFSKENPHRVPSLDDSIDDNEDGTQIE